MPQNFYEMLGVSSTASIPDIRIAYKKRLGALVQRKHDVEKSKSHTALILLQREERDIREAVDVLTNPVRRMRYNTFRLATDKGMPKTAGELWEQVEKSMLDPTAMYSLRLLASLTNLPLQNLSILQLGGKADDTDPEVTRSEEKTEPVGNSAETLRNKVQQNQVREDIKAFVAPQKSVSQKMATQSTVNLQKTLGDDTPTEIVAKVQSHPVKEPPKKSIPEMIQQYGITGELFRAVRESQGKSIAELGQQINVGANHILAIEQMNKDNLQVAELYIRSYVRSMAKALSIPDKNIGDSYIANLHKASKR